MSTLSRENALLALRLKEEEATEENIRAAFIRLARRYPPNQFPDRFSEIKAAYDSLTAPEKQFYDILSERNVDLSFLAKYIKKNLEEVAECLSDKDILFAMLQSGLADRRDFCDLDNIDFWKLDRDLDGEEC